MKKFKNVFIVLIVILAIVGIFFLSKLGEDRYFKKISYETYENLSSKGSVLLYVSSKGDKKDCKLIKEFAEENNLEIKYIYSEDLTNKQKEELLGEDNQAFIYSKDGKANSYKDDINTSNLTTYLKNQGVLPKTYIEITMNEFSELLKSEYFAIVIGRTGCHYCDEYKPIMNEVINSTSVNIYYLDIANLDEAGYNTLISSSNYLSNNQWGTPTTLLFKKGVEVDHISGYVDATKLTSFLTTNKVIK